MRPLHAESLSSSTPGRWAVVLAGGAGTRLSGLTRGANGVAVPKQFCSLRGGPSLLEDALGRASSVVAPDRIRVCVAPEHRPFWQGRLAPESLVVQPRTRGTAAGVLLPLLGILERDPDATVLILPADHHVEKEYVLSVTVRLAFEAVEDGLAGITLLGVAPEGPETSYGYIVPAERRGRLRRVTRFVEKPERSLARHLLAGGALWNAFMIVGRARALVELFRLRQPALLDGLFGAFALPGAVRERSLETAYADLGEVDFSRDVLTGCEERLVLLEVPPCGWTDLGTPERLESCLASLPRAPHRKPADRTSSWLDLRQALERYRAHSPLTA